MNINTSMLITAIQGLNERVTNIEKNIESLAKYILNNKSNNDLPQQPSISLSGESPISVSNNVISVDNAKVGSVGVVSPDGSTITINSNGVISSKQITVENSLNSTSQTNALSANQGNILDSKITNISDQLKDKQNVLTAANGLSLNNDIITANTASNSTLGVVKPDGTTIKIDSAGTISANSTGSGSDLITSSNDGKQTNIINDSILLQTPNNIGNTQNTINISNDSLLLQRAYKTNTPYENSNNKISLNNNNINISASKIYDNDQSNRITNNTMISISGGSINMNTTSTEHSIGSMFLIDSTGRCVISGSSAWMEITSDGLISFRYNGITYNSTLKDGALTFVAK